MPSGSAVIFSLSDFSKHFLTEKFPVRVALRFYPIRERQEYKLCCHIFLLVGATGGTG